MEPQSPSTRCCSTRGGRREQDTRPGGPWRTSLESHKAPHSSTITRGPVGSPHSCWRGHEEQLRRGVEDTSLRAVVAPVEDELAEAA